AVAEAELRGAGEPERAVLDLQRLRVGREDELRARRLRLAVYEHALDARTRLAAARRQRAWVHHGHAGAGDEPEQPVLAADRARVAPPVDGAAQAVGDVVERILHLV